jgi:ribosomal protein S18 acetylase RimI-like enzyme
MGGMVVVREVKPDEWETLREIRLAALREAPDAFGSTFARESVFTEEQWRQRLTSRAVTLFAQLDGNPEPMGLAGVYEEDGAADLVSMWVRPAGRGQRIGGALVGAACEWAKAHGHDSIFLWVTESNAPARRLYERCGFTPTGIRQPLPSNPALPEIRLRRPL